jgi:uncharacterized protein YecE (DUF72 family)
MAHPEVLIGTSGWSYDHWSGPFYPEDLPPRDRLSFYARTFDSVEVNTTFYHLPAWATVPAWTRAVPAGFVFALKASRYITHMKKLKEPDLTLPRFFEVAGLFGRALGPILFQLPPGWKPNPGRLAAFLDALPAGHRYAFELRNPEWWNGEVLGLLESKGAAFCIFELGGRIAPREVTAGFVYLRLHGPDGAYAGSYGEEALASWAEAVRDWAGRGLAVYVYFDNDQLGFAAQNAARLKQLVPSRNEL